MQDSLWLNESSFIGICISDSNEATKILFFKQQHQEDPTSLLKICGFEQDGNPGIKIGQDKSIGISKSLSISNRKLSEFTEGSKLYYLVTKPLSRDKTKFIFKLVKVIKLNHNRKREIVSLSVKPCDNEEPFMTELPFFFDESWNIFGFSETIPSGSNSENESWEVFSLKEN